MPISLRDLTKETKIVTKSFAGIEGTLTIEYRPRGLTPEAEALIHDASDRARAGETNVQFLLPLVVAWDLLDDEGAVVPLTAEALRRVSNAVLVLAIDAIAEDMRPNSQTGGGRG